MEASSAPPSLPQLPRDILNVIRGSLPIESLVVLRFVRPLRCFEGPTSAGRLKSLAEISRYALRSPSLLLWLRNHLRFPWNSVLTAAVAGTGNLAMFKYLIENNCPWDSSVYAAAAVSGHLGIISWARARPEAHMLTSAATSAAIAGGHLEVLKWLREFGCAINSDAVGPDAVKSLPILAYLIEDGAFIRPHSVAMFAAMGGHILALHWIKLRLPRPYSASLWSWGILFGHVSVLEWCKENAVTMSTDGWKIARRLNQAHIMEWYDHQVQIILHARLQSNPFNANIASMRLTQNGYPESAHASP